MTTTIQIRRDTAAAWTSANPTLAAGERGRETDSGREKVGDGTTAWAALPYESRGVVQGGQFSMTVLVPDAAPRTIYTTQNPGAVYDATSNKTFIAFLGGLRRLYVTFYDHATSTVAEPVYAAPYILTNPDDNHGAPSLAIDKSGYLVVMYGTHGDAGGPGIARSTNPRDITSWVAQRGVTSGGAALPPATYGSLCSASDVDAIYGAYRTGAGHGSTYPAHERGTIMRSTDHGATWTDLGATPGGLVNTKVAFPNDVDSDYYGTDCEYLIGPDGHGRVYLGWAVAHGPVHDGPRHGAYVAYLDVVDGHMHAPDGTDLGTSVDTAAKIAKCLIPGLDQDYVYPVRIALKPGATEITAVMNRIDTTVNLARVMAAHFNGTTWTVVEAAGILSNYTYHGTGVVWRNGQWEAFVVRNTTPDAVVTNFLAGDTLAGSSAGGDLVRITSPDGVTWSITDSWPASRFLGSQGCLYIQTVQNAHPDLVALCQGTDVETIKNAAGNVDTSTDVGYYDTTRWTSPIYAVHDRSVTPRGLGSDLKPEVTIRINPWNAVISSVVGPTGWTTVDLSGLVGKGCVAVWLKLAAIGNGTTGSVVADFRANRSNRASDASWTTRGEWTDKNVGSVLVQLGPDRGFQWKATPSTTGANATFTALLNGLVMGTAARMTDVPVNPGPGVLAAPDTTAPSVPGTPAAVAGVQSLSASTTGSSDNVAVAGYRWKVNGTEVTGQTGTAISVTGLTAGTSYTVTAEAYDAAGNYSGQSSASNAVTPTAPATNTIVYSNLLDSTTATALGAIDTTHLSDADAAFKLDGTGVAVVKKPASGVTTYWMLCKDAMPSSVKQGMSIKSSLGTTGTTPSQVMASPVIFATNLPAAGAAPTDCYWAGVDFGASTWVIYKILAGAQTAVATVATSTAAPLPTGARRLELYVKAVGSGTITLQLSMDGVDITGATYTDSAPLTGLYTGIRDRSYSGGASPALNNLTAKWYA